MEAREQTVARLVLGYLRSVGCLKAYNEFLKSSQHLVQYSDTNVESRYIPTRFNGLSLEEILIDYFKCYQTIQGRLEVTNYFNETHTEVDLEKQLLYLLRGVKRSHARMPVPDATPGTSQADEDNVSCIDLCSDSEVAPTDELIIDINAIEAVGTSTEAVGTSTEVAGTSTEVAGTSTEAVGTSTDNSEKVPSMVDTEPIVSSLMENKNFGNKLTGNINVRSFDPSQLELNESIRSALVQTENDPVFNEILNAALDAAKVDNDSGNGRDGETFNEGSSEVNKSEVLKKPILPYPGKNVETQTEVYPTVQATSFNTDVNQFVLPNPSPRRNQMFINTGSNLLVVPPQLPPTGRFSPNQYFVVNKACGDSYTYIRNPNAIQLSTVIPNDNTTVSAPVMVTPKLPVTAANVSQTVTTVEFSPSMRNKAAAQSSASGSNSNTDPTTSAAPKPSADVHCANDGEGQTNKADTETERSTQTVVINEIVDTYKRFNQTETKNNMTVVTFKPALCANTDGTPVQHFQYVPWPVSKDGANTIIRSNSSPNTCKPISITPLQRSPLKKVTPKSTSHVRNLDFSTPHKKPATEMRENECKINASKTLFKPERTVDVKRPWDADLRVSLETPEEKTVPTKRKRRSAGDKTVPTVKKSKSTKKENKYRSEVDPSLEETIPINQKENEIVGKNKNETLSKIILSPSRYNANKRALVGESNAMSFATPETGKQRNVQQFKPGHKSSCVVMTPIKGHIKTPGATTPAETTPFTKMLEANIRSMDISSIATPDFPPFTPTVDLLSPCSSRPTDYSGGSYYQPSDNEVNKSLEEELAEINVKPNDVTVCHTGLEIPGIAEMEALNETEALATHEQGVIEKNTTRQSLRRKNARTMNPDQERNDNEKAENKTQEKLKSPKKKSTLAKNTETPPKRKLPSRKCASGAVNYAAESTETDESDYDHDDTIFDPNSSQMEPKRKKPRRNTVAIARGSSQPEIENYGPKPDSSEVEPVQEKTLMVINKKKQERKRLEDPVEIVIIDSSDSSETESVQKDFRKGKSAISPPGECEERIVMCRFAKSKTAKRRSKMNSKNTKTSQLKKSPRVHNVTQDDLSLTSNISEYDEHDNAEGSDMRKDLIPWLRKRGIHLIENKENKDKVGSRKINISDISKEVSYCVKPSLDTETFEEPNASFVFNGTAEESEWNFEEEMVKPFRIFTAKICMEELDIEVEVTLIHSKLFSLIEIRGENFKAKDLSYEKHSDTMNYDDDDMSLEEETFDRLNTNEGIQDTSTQAKNLLRGLNVDTFLNNIHGNSSSEF